MRLHDALDYWARERPDAEFAVQQDRRLTYAQAEAAVNRIAHAFIAAGLAPGDRVAVLAKNCLEYAVLYYGAAKAGVVLVPLNFRLAPAEWTYIINDAGARLLLAAGEYVAAVDRFRDALTTVAHCVALGAPAPDGWQDYTSWVSDRPASPPDRSVDEEADLYQMYTSGTTGRPKGAVLTHRSVTANIAQVAGILRWEAGERSLVVAPMFHAIMVLQAFTPVYWGAGLYIMAEFDPAETVRVLDEERIAIWANVPAMLQACLLAPGVAERRYRDLRLIFYGGSPAAEPTIRQGMGVFRCAFAQGYGMTEASCALLSLTPADHERALAEQPRLLLAAGRPFMGTELRIVDAQDRPLPPGTVGEIVVRGPQLMRGYWNMPEATAETLRGGWLHTGDAATIDDEGYVSIQDRVKDMIVSGGENIYPREVEIVLHEHPAVADVAVIGVPDARFGECVKAVVVRHPGATTTAEELIDFCRGRLGSFKRPRSVEFIDVLPRNPSGKVLKRVLREPYWTGQSRRVAGA